MTTYALIDSAQHPGFHLKLTQLGIQFQSLFDGHPERNLPEIAPLLLVAPASDTDRERAAAHMIARLAAEKPAVSHLSSELGLGDLASHLRRFHLAMLPANRHMIVRWYDTRVLPAWLRVLSPRQRSSFLMGIQGWRYFDRFGDGQDVHVGDGDTVEAPVPEMPACQSLSLDQHQYDSLMRAAEADALLVRLKQVVRDELKQVDARTLYKFVSTQLQSSRSHGLTRMKDHVQFVLMALYTNGRSVEHPYVRAHLTAQASDGAPSAEWLRTVPDDVLETGSPLWKQTA